MTRVLEREVNLSRRACRKFPKEFTSHKKIANAKREFCKVNHVCYERWVFLIKPFLIAFSRAIEKEKKLKNIF